MSSDHPGPEDLPYLRAYFVPLDDLARACGYAPSEVRRAISAEILPGVAYRLEDNTELVAPDYFVSVEMAGDFAAVRPWFIHAYDVAAARVSASYDAGTGAEQWPEYVSGGYAACLRVVTPASIVAKGQLMEAIERMAERPAPDDARWRAELTAAVDALDVLERPFALFDRKRGNGSTSRDRCITAMRDRFRLPVASLRALTAGAGI